MNAKTINPIRTSTGIHPLKFTLWLLIMSIVMMFAAFTSAYIVRREEGNWLEFNLPGALLINSIIIVLSSVAMQWAYLAARKDNLNILKVALFLTFILGTAFLIGQWNVWGDLVKNKIFFGGPTANPSGSFMYVLTGVHGFHLITGLIFILVVLSSAFRYRVHAKNLLQIELCTTYWHFLGVLWVYLYVFLAVYH
ncbi:cytochrome c oxidase subunit 3 [Adhaeribacter radiodurans]|uniref:Cytochrome c oxidase subunit 3 n=1 Tax=Adhaeribacter radiodurans TaxID=2745197 RepID=A0A7L7L329_9BACT|nr:cytochrome c oxidase subunit 3 [Adhaeribacter radiodurans]QMU27207.1 cytochrome c oxidase subunit 3 [Adhaeribacter radiodurans]